MYCGSGTGRHCCICEGQKLCVHSSGVSTFLREMTSWPSWKCIVKSEIRLRQLTRIYRAYLKNIAAKCHPDPIWNDGACRFLKTVASTRSAIGRSVYRKSPSAPSLGTRFYHFQLPTPTLSLQSPHLSNDRRWCRLAYTVKHSNILWTSEPPKFSVRNQALTSKTEAGTQNVFFTQGWHWISRCRCLSACQLGLQDVAWYMPTHQCKNQLNR